MLCYVMLCYVMLCYVMLYYIILYYIILYCTGPLSCILGCNEGPVNKATNILPTILEGTYSCSIYILSFDQQ